MSRLTRNRLAKKLEKIKGISKPTKRRNNDALTHLKADFQEPLDELAAIAVTPEKPRHPILDRKVRTQKERQLALARERNNIKLVLENSTFQTDPMSAIKNHLENLVKSVK